MSINNVIHKIKDNQKEEPVVVEWSLQYDLNGGVLLCANGVAVAGLGHTIKRLNLYNEEMESLMGGIMFDLGYTKKSYFSNFYNMPVKVKVE